MTLQELDDMEISLIASIRNLDFIHQESFAFTAKSSNKDLERKERKIKEVQEKIKKDNDLKLKIYSTLSKLNHIKTVNKQYEKEINKMKLIISKYQPLQEKKK